MLGYDVDPQGGRLVVNQEEAGQVRKIYSMAAEGATLEAMVTQLAAGGYQSKAWASKAGKPHLARSFRSGSSDPGPAINAANVSMRLAAETPSRFCGAPGSDIPRTIDLIVDPTELSHRPHWRRDSGLAHTGDA